MNIFDIIDQKEREAKAGQTKLQTTKPQQSTEVLDEKTIDDQTLTYTADQFIEFAKMQMSVQGDKRLRFSPAADYLENVNRIEYARVVCMAKFIRTSPNITQVNFEHIMQDSRLKAFNKIVSDYPYNDFVEEIRDHGALYIVSKINAYRKDVTQVKPQNKEKEYIMFEDWWN